LKYRVYLSRYAGRATTRPAVLTTDAGATSAFVTLSAPGGTYYAVVHAVDEQGNEDANRVEKSAVADADTQRPVFAGLKSAASAPGAAVALAWEPATDDKTPPEGLRYQAYVVDGVGGATLVGSTLGRSEMVVPGGPTGSRRRYLVRVADAAGNTDSNDVVRDAESGADARPPSFAGCEAVDVLGSRAVRVRWQPAVDETTPATALRYEVFAASAPGAQDFTKPSATATGVGEVVVRALPPSATSHFVCRARDAAGNLDANVVEKSARTTDNVTPPTFAGATGAVDGIAREVSFTWAPAADDTTPPANIVYVVYQGRGGAFDFETPIATSAPGATSLVVKDLPSRSALQFVVRARDADYNEDTNRVETAGTTRVSYTQDVAPFFARQCAVVGCHVGSAVDHGVPFSLAPFDAYERSVNVVSAQPFGVTPPFVRYRRVNPGDANTSYLFLKMRGTPGIRGDAMPAAATGTVLDPADLELVRSWIADGAAKN